MRHRELCLGRGTDVSLAGSNPRSSAGRIRLAISPSPSTDPDTHVIKIFGLMMAMLVLHAPGLAAQTALAAQRVGD